jgi:hypothetical protein
MEREVSAGHSLPGEGGGKDKSGMRIKRVSKGHSRPREHRGWDKSWHGKRGK